MAAARGRNREGPHIRCRNDVPGGLSALPAIHDRYLSRTNGAVLADLPTEPFGRSRFLKARPIPFCRERICIYAVRFSARVLHRLGNAKREDALVSGGIYLSRLHR